MAQETTLWKEAPKQLTIALTVNFTIVDDYRVIGNILQAIDCNEERHPGLGVRLEATLERAFIVKIIEKSPKILFNLVDSVNENCPFSCTVIKSVFHAVES